MDEIKDQLKSFPSSFDFETNDFVSQRLVQKTISKLQNDDESSTKSNEERMKINNFISFLFSLCGDVRAALEYCEKSLEIDSKCLTANSNKCHILLSNGNVSDAKDVLNHLIEFKREEGFQKRLANAKADLAYSYSRSGPLYHERAVQTYREVTSEYPDQYEWKFGLGLMLVRQSHLLNTNKKDMLQHRKNMNIEALLLLYEVAEHTHGTNKILCGKAWIESGEILYRNTFDEYDFSEKGSLYQLRNFDTKSCFDNALDICPFDPFVLRKSGQYCRYFRELERSEQLLRKAKDLHDNCSVNHHLALTLMKKVDMEQKALIRSQSDPGRLRQPSQCNDSSNDFRTLDYDLAEEMRNISLVTQSHIEQQTQFIVPRLKQNYTSPDRLNLRCIHNSNPEPHYSASSNLRGEYRRRPARNSRKHVSYQRQYYHPADHVQSSFYNSPQYMLLNDSLEQPDHNSFVYRGRRTWRRARYTGTRRYQRGRRQYNNTGGSIANCVKSPQNVIVCPGHPVLVEALKYLERAVEISQGPMIMYDLALLHRKLDKPEEALEILYRIANVKEMYTSEASLVGVYEQMGMCYLDLSHKASQSDKKKKYTVNAESMFSIAIERQATFVKEEQDLKNAWNSYPTLKSLLEEKSERPALKMLAKAHNMMKEHEEAIKVLETLHQKGELNAKEYQDMITTYVSVENFQQAMVLLKYLHCTEQFKELDCTFAIDTYIKGALYALKSGDVPTAMLRFRDAYNTAKPYNCKPFDTASRSRNEEMRLKYEVHVVHKCCFEDDCHFTELLVNLLEQYTDIKTTVNTEDSMGLPDFTAMSITMRNSENIVVMVHPETREFVEGESKMFYNQASVTQKESGGEAEMCHKKANMAHKELEGEAEICHKQASMTQKESRGNGEMSHKQESMTQKESGGNGEMSHKQESMAHKESGGDVEMCYNQALMASMKSGGNIIVVIPESSCVPEVLELPNVNVVTLPPVVCSGDPHEESKGEPMIQKWEILQTFFEALCKLKPQK